MYNCLADMPIEVGDVYFFCLGWDQREEASQRMMDMAKQKQNDLSRLLNK